MNTINFLIITVSTVFLFASCEKKPVVIENSEQPVCVQAEIIQETTITNSIHCSGILSSKQISKLSFKTGGIINRMLVDEGSVVRKGQVLATLDMTEISAQVNQARVASEKAGRDLERAKNLFADSVVTLEVLQNATSAYDAAFETKNIAEFNQRYSQIVAPSNGRIIGKLTEVNELIAPGMPVLIFSEQATDEWIVKAGVSDKDRVAIKIGDNAVLSFDAFRGKEFTAKVTQLSELADQTSGTFEVELTVKPGDTRFINGLVAAVKISSSFTQTVSLLPPNAITEVNGMKGFVYVVNPENATAKKIPVTISYIENNELAILEPISQMGMVITKGATYLEDGSKIKIYEKSINN
jgi:membrane fusion protein, multidrug efflux system